MAIVKIELDGSWKAPDGSEFRSLTPQEVKDLQAMAEKTTPEFGGPHNATWDQHHPVAREVWERLGVKPKEIV